MRTIIHSSDFALTNALNAFIKLHAIKSMTPCADQVERLVIRLKDINEPKGGNLHLPSAYHEILRCAQNDSREQLRDACRRLVV